MSEVVQFYITCRLCRPELSFPERDALIVSPKNKKDYCLFNESNAESNNVNHISNFIPVPLLLKNKDLSAGEKYKCETFCPNRGAKCDNRPYV